MNNAVGGKYGECGDQEINEEGLSIWSNELV